MGIDIPDWAISAEILTQAGRRAPLLLPHLAAVGLAVALPHRVGLVAVPNQPPLTQRLTKSRRECPSCDTSPNFQAQTALEFAGAELDLPPSGDIHQQLVSPPQAFAEIKFTLEAGASISSSFVPPRWENLLSTRDFR